MGGEGGYGTLWRFCCERNDFLFFIFYFLLNGGGGGGIWYILFLPPLVSDVKDIFNINIKGQIQY